MTTILPDDVLAQAGDLEEEQPDLFTRLRRPIRDVTQAVQEHQQISMPGLNDLKVPDLSQLDPRTWGQQQQPTQDQSTSLADVSVPELSELDPTNFRGALTTMGGTDESEALTQPGGAAYTATPGSKEADIYEAANEFGIRPDLFDRQLTTEGAKSDDVWFGQRGSSAGAMGPGQFMPDTGDSVARELGVTPEQFWADPKLQVRGAALHMRNLLQKYGGDYATALAAYNAGEGAVAEYGGPPPYEETQRYLSSILGSDRPTHSPGGERNPVVGRIPAPGQSTTGEFDSLTPNQLADFKTLSYEDALSACGPAALMAFMRANGRNPTEEEALNLAKGVGWTPEIGMRGIQSEVEALTRAGIAASIGPVDEAKMGRDIQRGNPVMVNFAASESGPGHYFVAQNYNPETGEFDWGNSLSILRASGGRRWMTLEELQNIPIGTMSGAIYADSPLSNSPSVVAGRSPIRDMGTQGVSNAPDSAGGTGGDAPRTDSTAGRTGSPPDNGPFGGLRVPSMDELLSGAGEISRRGVDALNQGADAIGRTINQVNRPFSDESYDEQGNFNVQRAHDQIAELDLRDRERLQDAEDELTRTQRREGLNRQARRGAIETGEEVEDTSPVGQLIRGLQASTVGNLGSLASSVSLLGRLRNAPAVEAMATEQEGRFRDVLADHPEWQRPSNMADVDWKNPSWYARVIGEGVPSLLGGMAASALGAIAGAQATRSPIGAAAGSIGGGFAFSLLSEGGQQYREGMEAGADPDNIAKLAITGGAINGAIEQIPFFKPLMRTAPGSQMVRMLGPSILANIAAQGIQEGTEEVLQEVVSNAVAKTYDDARGLFDNALAAFAGGALVGGAVHAVGAGGEAIARRGAEAVKGQPEPAYALERDFTPAGSIWLQEAVADGPKTFQEIASIVNVPEEQLREALLNSTGGDFAARGLDEFEGDDGQIRYERYKHTRQPANAEQAREMIAKSIRDAEVPATRDEIAAGYIAQIDDDSREAVLERMTNGDAADQRMYAESPDMADFNDQFERMVQLGRVVAMQGDGGETIYRVRGDNEPEMDFAAAMRETPEPPERRFQEQSSAPQRMADEERILDVLTRGDFKSYHQVSHDAGVPPSMAREALQRLAARGQIDEFGRDSPTPKYKLPSGPKLDTSTQNAPKTEPDTRESVSEPFNLSGSRFTFTMDRQGVVRNESGEIRYTRMNDGRWRIGSEGNTIFDNARGTPELERKYQEFVGGRPTALRRATVSPEQQRANDEIVLAALSKTGEDELRPIVEATGLPVAQVYDALYRLKDDGKVAIRETQNGVQAFRATQTAQPSATVATQETRYVLPSFVGRSAGVGGRRITREELASGSISTADEGRPGDSDQGALAEQPARDVPRVQQQRNPRARVQRPSAADAGADERSAREGGLAPSVRVEPSDAGDSTSGLATPPAPLTQQTNITPVSPKTDYIMTDADITFPTPVVGFRANLNAIKLLKQLQAENRQATPEEQAVLAKYTGFGPSAYNDAFPRYGGEISGTGSLPEMGRELRSILTDDEYRSIEGSRLNANYTTPEVIRAMWNAVGRLGFDRFPAVRVLDPATGSGRFYGLMPTDLAEKSVRWGVELDQMTGALFQQVFPNAYQQITGFENALIPNDSVDLAITNVPFSNIRPADRSMTGPAKNQSLHNYYFAKALQKVRPGGAIAFVTTHFTLDAPSQAKFRSWMNDQAELLGAIRLPQDAFPDTSVTTDIIFLRKRTYGEGAPAQASWIRTTRQKDPRVYGDVGEYDINSYFVEHPEMALGQHTMSEGRGLRTRYEYRMVKRPDFDAAKDINAAIARLPANVIEPLTDSAPALDPLAMEAANGKQAGAFIEVNGELMQNFRTADGNIVVRKPTGGTGTEYNPGQIARVRQTMKIRDAARSVLERQLTGADESEVKTAQRTLNREYGKFVREYGPLTQTYNAGVFSKDPDAGFVRALENREAAIKLKDAVAEKKGKTTTYRWDKVTDKQLEALKMPIFHEIVARAARRADTASSPKDAMLVVLNEAGKLDFDRMASLLGGTTPQAVIDELVKSDLIYNDPNGGWQTQDEYLSGHVRAKLDMARAAAQRDPQFERNVDALEKVQPKDLEPADIELSLGTPVVEPEDVEAFITHLLGEPFTVSYQPAIGTWSVNKPRWTSVPLSLMNQKWGTDDATALELVDDILNSRPIEVAEWQVDVNGNRHRVKLPKETLAAQAKGKEIALEFKRWVWDDADRAERLARAYNDRYNATVPRDYDGSHLTLPGTSTVGEMLYPHQRSAIWRILQDGTVLLAHEVGFGKTWSMAAAAMELRRLGLARKSIMVVPNHLVEQFSREFYILYPNAKLLVPTKGDFETKNRQELMGRIATGDWDAVVVAQTHYKMLPVRPETEQAFIQQQIDDLEEAIRDSVAKGNSREPSHKQLQRRKKGLEAKLQKAMKGLAESRTRGLYFEDLGIDQIFVDEADMFKNLAFTTAMGNIKGLNSNGSDRAFDMLMKVRDVQRRLGGRGVVFATGTPISNTIGELWTMMRYLMPERMADLGIQNFDSWAKLFGDTRTAVEMTHTGAIKPVTRFAQFQNAAELARIFQSMADVRVQDELPEMAARKPRLRAGERQKVTAEGSDDLKAFMVTIRERAEELERKSGPPQKGDDNHLVITTDARKAALDMRIVDSSAREAPDSKINKMVDNLAEVYQREKADKGTQLVFVDLATPKAIDDAELEAMEKREADAFAKAQAAGDVEPSESEQLETETDDEKKLINDIYNVIRAKLRAKGIKDDEIAFAHTFKTKPQRDEMSRKINDGTIRVLIGSTEKMGAGSNFHQRLAALHHLDVPWRPRDLIQREGRILRPGNKVYGPKVDQQGKVIDPGRGVDIYQYVTEGSFDAFMWAGVVAKARAISSFMRRNVSIRNVEDADEFVVSAQIAMAAATGNPEVMRMVELRGQEAELAAAEGEFRNNQQRARREIQSTKSQITGIEGRIKLLDTMIAKRNAIGKDLTANWGGVTFGKDDRPKAGEVLMVVVAPHTESKEYVDIGTINAFTVKVARGGWKGHYELAIADPESGHLIDRTDGETAKMSAQGLMQRLENMVRGLDKEHSDAQGRLAAQRRRLADFEKMGAAKFPRIGELTRLRLQIARIEQRLAASDSAKDGEPLPPLEEDLAAAVAGVEDDAPAPAGTERSPGSVEESRGAEPVAGRLPGGIQQADVADGTRPTEPPTPEGIRAPATVQEEVADAGTPSDLGRSPVPEVPPPGPGDLQPVQESPVREDGPIQASGPTDVRLPSDVGRDAERSPAPTPKHEFSSTQINLPPELAAQVLELGQRIPDANIDQDAGGLETEPHVTVRYGLHTDSADDVRPIIEAAGPIPFKTSHKVSVFTGGDADVVKIDVMSPALRSLNKKLGDLPNTQTFDYHPHITVAYVKKGEGARVAKQLTENWQAIEGTADSVAFSDKSGQHTEIALGGAGVAPVGRNARQAADNQRVQRPASEGSPERESPDIRVAENAPGDTAGAEVGQLVATPRRMRPERIPPVAPEPGPEVRGPVEEPARAVEPPADAVPPVVIPATDVAPVSPEHPSVTTAAPPPTEVPAADTGGVAAGAPPVEPPVGPPPAPPIQPPPDDGDGRSFQHVVGFGYAMAGDEEAKRLADRADDDAEFSRSGGVRMEDMRESALEMLESDEADLVRKYNEESTVQRAVETDALRVDAWEAATRVANLQADIERMRASGTASDAAEMTAADQALTAAIAIENMVGRAARRAGEAAGRTLGMMRHTVVARYAQKTIDRLLSFGDTTDDVLKVIKKRMDGHMLTAADLAVLDGFLARMAGVDGSLITDETDTQPILERLEGLLDQTQTRRRRKGGVKDEGSSGFSRHTERVISSDPELAARAMSLVEISREMLIAREARNWARHDALEEARRQLYSEILEMLGDRAEPRQARQRRPQDLDARAARRILARARQEAQRQVGTQQEQSEEAARRRAFLRALVKEATTGTQIDPRAMDEHADRLASINQQEAEFRGRMLLAQENNDADAVTGMQAEIDQLVAERRTIMGDISRRIEADVRRELAIRQPNLTPEETETAVRRKMAQGAIGKLTREMRNDLKFPNREWDRLAERLDKKIQRSIEDEDIKEVLEKIRRVVAIGRNHAGASIESSEELQMLYQHLGTMGERAKNRASLMRESLFRAGLSRLTSDMTKEDTDNLVEALKMLRSDNIKGIHEFIRNLRKPGVGDYLRAYVFGNMLSSPLTWGLTGVNTVGNVLQIGTYMGERTGQILSDQLQGGKAGTSFAELPAMLAGMREYAPAAASQAWQILRYGNPREAYYRAISTGDLAAVRREVITEAIGPIGLVFEGAGRMMRATDALLGYTLYGGVVRAEVMRKANIDARTKHESADKLYAEYMENLWDHPEILERAGKIEDYVLLREKDAVLKTINRLWHPDPKAPMPMQVASVVANQLIPFMTVAYNYMKQGIERSMIGVAFNTSRAYVGWDSVKRRPTFHNDPEKFAEFMGKAMLGLAITAMGLMLKAAGNLTGDAPDDEAERKLWEANHRENSWRMGPGMPWISHLGTPVSIPWAMLDGAIESYKKSTSTATAGGLMDHLAAGAGGAAIGAAKGLYGQSFMQTLGDMEAVISGRTKPDAFMAGQVSRYIPAIGFLGWMARVGDEYERDAKTFAERIQSRTPLRGGLRIGVQDNQYFSVDRPTTLVDIPALPIRQDVLGGQVRNQQYGAMGLVPFRPGRPELEGNQTVAEFERLGITISKPPTKLDGIAISPTEQRRYQQIMGQELQTLVARVTAKPSYQRMDKEFQAELLEDMEATARDLAEAQVMKEMGRDELRRRYRESFAPVAAR